MSKLEELIKELCPNGVEYVELQKVCNFNRGTSITSKEVKGGDVPVVSGGQQPAFYHNVANREANSITIAGSGAYAGYVSFWENPIFCADSFTVDVKNKNKLDKRYLYHFLLNKQNYIYSRKQGAGIPHVHGKDIARLQIPLPPLAVQREIVRILDKFTLYSQELAAELAALYSQELAAELAARKKQYEFYRDKLLSFDNLTNGRYNLNNLVRIVKLGEIGRVCMCKRILKSQTSSIGDVPFYKIGTFGGEADAYISQQLYEEYKAKYSYPKIGDVLISAAGTIGRTVIFDGAPAYFQDSNIVWIDNNEKIVLNKYLFYCYQLKPWQVSSGGTISRLYNENIR